jgi:hypothetical protein
MQQPMDRFGHLRPRDAEYLMHFSKRHRYLYVECPKVACSTIKTTLMRLELAGKPLPENIHFRPTSPLFGPRSDPAGFQEAVTSPRYVRFAFVRNPFTRILSAYLDKIVDRSKRGRAEQVQVQKSLGVGVPISTVSFEDFLKIVRQQTLQEMDVHWLPQASVLVGIPRLTFIGRFERLEDDLSNTLRIIAPRNTIAVEERRPHATGAREKIKDLITAEARDLIAEIYRDDFIRYGYSFDPALATSDAGASA